nr:MAG TPA: hypothetical protein [Caudoviricetes sp.]
MTQLLLVGIHHLNGTAGLITRAARTDNGTKCLGDTFSLILRFMDAPNENLLTAKRCLVPFEPFAFLDIGHLICPFLWWEWWIDGSFQELPRCNKKLYIEKSGNSPPLPPQPPRGQLFRRVCSYSGAVRDGMAEGSLPRFSAMQRSPSSERHRPTYSK